MNRPPQHHQSSTNNIPIIQQPGENDILCGRGGGTNAHIGNIKFRKLVAAHKLRYLAAAKSDKPNVARDVVKEWRSMDPPGRFLAKMDMKQMILANLITVEDVKNEQLQLQQQQQQGGGSGGSGDGKKNKKEQKVYWYDVGDKKAREKASQCLRERNGAANEAVAALVKTVTANGESCPEDYATLMDRAAKVKEQQMQNVMSQQQGVGMGAQQQRNMMMNPENVMSGGGGMMNNTMGNMNNNGGGGSSAEDDVIEAEIQRLLREKQEQMMMSMGAASGGGGGNNSNRNMGGGGGVGRGGGQGYGDIQPYMGEESILQEYQALLQKQQELDMRLANANAMMNNQMMGGGGGGGGMMMGGNSGMMGGGSPYGKQQQQHHNNNMMPQAYQDSPNNNMSPNPNPNAARDYMNRLRMLRQGGGGGGMDLPYGDNNNMMGGGGGMLPPENVMSNNMGGGNMNGMGGVRGGGGGGGGGQNFSIEEYQASLQEFLGHDDGGNTGLFRDNSMSEQTQATQQINNTSNTKYGGRTIETIQVPTNLNDGGSRRSTGRRNSDKSIDDIDLPIGRNTFKSVDSADRPSFQSMDDMGIRDTFRSVDTMDLMSIGASLNEIVEGEIKMNPEVRKKYSRRLSASSRHSRYASGNNQGGGEGGPSLNDFAHLPGATVQVKTLNHGQGGGNGPKKIRKAIDPRLVAMAGKSDGGNKRGSALSTDLDLDGLEDGRMSFGNMSLMSELTDFGDIITKGLGDGDL